VGQIFVAMLAGVCSKEAVDKELSLWMKRVEHMKRLKHVSRMNTILSPNTGSSNVTQPYRHRGRNQTRRIVSDLPTTFASSLEDTRTVYRILWHWLAKSV